MQSLTRTQAVDELRGHLARLADDEHSVCEVATRLDIFCHGFSQWTDTELRDRYDWIVKRRPDITRAELTRIANLWQLARQEVHGEPTACDVQCSERDTCRGWDEWSNTDIAKFLREMTGQPVEVV